MTKVSTAFVSTGTDTLAIALSSLNYSATDGLYWATRDSGTGLSDWGLYLFGLACDTETGQYTVQKTIPIKWPSGVQANGAELDPEGAVFVGNGWWVCEEYKPQIFFVDMDGVIQQQVPAPDFLLGGNKVKGRGFEGLTADPKSGHIYTILQWGPYKNEQGYEQPHTQTYICGYDPAAGTWTTWTYHLEDPADYGLDAKAWIGSSGIHAFDHRELLVIERDNKSGDQMRVKQVWKASLPKDGGTAEKVLVADLLKLDYTYEKVEGITIGPDGDVYVINDNDGSTEPNTTCVAHFKVNLSKGS